MKKVLLFITLLILVVRVDAKEVNLSDLSKIKTYEMKDYDNFLKDYKNNKLDGIYITKFLFDGVSMYKPYDLDDLKEKENEYKVKPLEITVININDIGDYTFTGELIGGMLAVNTNDKKGNINIILDNAKLDTDSKKIPVMYIYNKDILYTDAIVTIKTTPNSKNYLEGGKLKKISLMDKNNLEIDRLDKEYFGLKVPEFEKYNSYYGIYSSKEIDNILFAKMIASRENIKDEDPLYFYKASGAISSDIDINFEGLGYLEIISKNKEGIEGKGNISFLGGTGDYVIKAEDDGINAKMTSKENPNAHHDITINVNSLYIIVNPDVKDGDAIDSNGRLIINGGLILAIGPSSGLDTGLDSEETYLNKGTILATGNILEPIHKDSKQKYMILSFAEQTKTNSNITLLNNKDEVVFSYTTDRPYNYLIFSSSSLDGNNYLYQNGNIEGTNEYGYYTNINSYKKGINLGYMSYGNEVLFRYENRLALKNTYDKLNNAFKISKITNVFGKISEYKISDDIKSNNYLNIIIILLISGTIIILFIVNKNKTKVNGKYMSKKI